jgi:hypothetical protein
MEQAVVKIVSTGMGYFSFRIKFEIWGIYKLLVILLDAKKIYINICSPQISSYYLIVLLPWFLISSEGIAQLYILFHSSIVPMAIECWCSFFEEAFKFEQSSKQQIKSLNWNDASLLKPAYTPTMGWEAHIIYPYQTATVNGCC